MLRLEGTSGEDLVKRSSNTFDQVPLSLKSVRAGTPNICVFINDVLLYFIDSVQTLLIKSIKTRFLKQSAVGVFSLER